MLHIYVMLIIYEAIGSVFVETSMYIVRFFEHLYNYLITKNATGTVFLTVYAYSSLFLSTYVTPYHSLRTSQTE
jgi:hypothetical protein